MTNRIDTSGNPIGEINAGSSLSTLNWIFGENIPFENKCENGTKIPEGSCFGCEEGRLCE